MTRNITMGLLALLTAAAVGCEQGGSSAETPSDAPDIGTTAASDLTAGRNDAGDETAEPGGLPVLGQLPPFELIEQNNRPLTNADLLGRIWIAQFFFTRCQATCPRQLEQMVRLADSFRDSDCWDDLRLVNFSVDPEYDTPDVLQQQAKALNATSRQWLFVTGDRTELWNLCERGFKLPVRSAPPDSGSPIVHATTFVLVDPQGRIRGYYNGLNDGEVDQLRSDVDAIWSEQNGLHADTATDPE